VKEEPAEPEEPAVAKDTHKKKADLEEVAARNDYVSRFEKLADTSKPKQAAPVKKKRKKGDDDGIKTRNDELLRQLKSQGTDIAKPVYTEEELDEIERQAQEEEDAKYDIDYDEYEEYYEE
jgi:N utilization substance protein A